MKYVTSLAYLVALILVVFYVRSRFRKFGFFDFPVYFFSFIAIFHLFVPIIMLSNIEILSVVGSRFPVNVLPDQLFLNLVIVFTTSCMFLFGWNLGGNLPIVFSREMKHYRNYSAAEHHIEWIPWFFLLIGAFGFYLYFSAFGGVFQALEVAREFRTGSIEVSNPYSFMRSIGDFVKIAMVLFFALGLSNRTKASVWLGMAIAMAFSILMLLFQGGRLNIAIFAGILVAIYWARNERVSSAVIGITALVMAVMLYYGYDILFSVYRFFGAEQISVPYQHDEMSVLDFIFFELSFPSLSLIVAHDAISSGAVLLRYGVDVIIGLTSIIPERIWSIDMPRAGTVHTAHANPIGAGSIPVDIVTYGIYSFGFAIGPALCGFCVGIVSRFVFRHVSRLPWLGVRVTFQVLFLAQFARSLAYFDPSQSINRIYYIVIAFFIVYAAGILHARRAKRLRVPDRGSVKPTPVESPIRDQKTPCL